MAELILLMSSSHYHTSKYPILTIYLSDCLLSLKKYVKLLGDFDQLQYLHRLPHHFGIKLRRGQHERDDQPL